MDAALSTEPAQAAADCPALLLAAPASGQGKTLVTAALARLLTRRGQRVRVFKCGPDFVDPYWHALASDAPVHNLDAWMTGPDDMRARLHQAAREADAILIEGVMGLHDGSPGGLSSAQLARLLDLPVLAVVQAGAMAQTLGALVHGLRHYRAAPDAPLRWAGVLANGVASSGHAGLLRDGLDASDGWLGHLPRDEALHLPERHLGLVAAHELGTQAALARLDAAADLLEATPLGQLAPEAWRARWSVRFAAPAARPPVARLLDGRTVAVAHDAAFAFVYQANLDVLRQLGARLVFFSPLAGDSLPPCDALWLPGGYPELHAARLSAHTALVAQLCAHVAVGRPIWAEGGGLMALCLRLTDGDGNSWPTWGLLWGQARLSGRLAGLGLQQWAPPGAATALRGHGFHYGVCVLDGPPVAHTQAAPGSLRPEGEPVWQCGSVRASFFHPWFASAPEAAAALFLPPMP